MANTNVTIRMDDELKAQADELFDDLGMSFTTAVNIFVRQAVREGRIPFEITRAASSASMGRAAAIEFNSEVSD